MLALSAEPALAEPARVPAKPRAQVPPEQRLDDCAKRLRALAAAPSGTLSPERRPT